MTVATGLRYVSLQFRAGFDACHPQDRRLVREMLFDYTHSAAASAYSSGGVSADDVTREPQCVSLRKTSILPR